MLQMATPPVDTVLKGPELAGGARLGPFLACFPFRLRRKWTGVDGDEEGCWTATDVYHPPSYSCGISED